MTFPGPHLVSILVITLLGTLCIGSFTPLGRWYVQVREVGTFQGVCETVDVVLLGGSRLAFQLLSFNSSNLPRAARFASGAVTLDGAEVLSGRTLYRVLRARGGCVTLLGEPGGAFVMTRRANPPQGALAREMDRLRAQGVQTERVPQNGCRYPPLSVQDFDADKYRGAWLAVATRKGGPGGGPCGSAFYGKFDGVSFSVLNAAWRTPGGEEFVRGVGEARLNTKLFPGQFTVMFRIYGRDVKGSYWVVDVGPVRNGKYEYAVVAGPELDDFFIIARNPTRYRRLYERSVNRFVTKELGFKKSMFAFTEQGKNCKYVPEVANQLPQ